MKVCHVSTFLPTPCGIATYTGALIAALPRMETTTCRLSYETDSKCAPTKFDFQLNISQPAAHRRIAERINDSETDVVSIQHEFGIFGGADGEQVNSFAAHLRKPIVTTLHTTPANPDDSKRRILLELIERSDRVVLLSERSQSNILSYGGIEPKKTCVIRHGVPPNDIPSCAHLPVRRSSCVLVSAGHYRVEKGYDVALRALAILKGEYNDFRFYIVGGVQEQFPRHKAYFETVTTLIHELDLSENVEQITGYASDEVFLEWIKYADFYLVSYRDLTQNSSGMIPLALRCARPVISTPFEYAKDMSAIAGGIIISSSCEPEDICKKIKLAISERLKLNVAMKSVQKTMRQWEWPNVAEMYRAVFASCSGTG